MDAGVDPYGVVKAEHSAKFKRKLAAAEEKLCQLVRRVKMKEADEAGEVEQRQETGDGIRKRCEQI